MSIFFKKGIQGRDFLIPGYYRGNFHRVGVVKSALKGAEEFIKKLG